MDGKQEVPYNPGKISHEREDEISAIEDKVLVDLAVEKRALDDIGADLMPIIKAHEKASSEAEFRKKRIATLLDTIFETTLPQEGFARPYAAQQHDSIDAINELDAMGISRDEYWDLLFSGGDVGLIADELMRNHPKSPLLDLNRVEYED
jgi:hypothetical protein